MEVVEWVLGGQVQGDLVTLINSFGGQAVGLTGKDGGLIRAKKLKLQDIHDPTVFYDVGQVGEIESINPASISCEVRPVIKFPSLSSTPGVLVSITSFSALSVSAIFKSRKKSSDRKLEILRTLVRMMTESENKHITTKSLAAAIGVSEAARRGSSEVRESPQNRKTSPGSLALISVSAKKSFLACSAQEEVPENYDVLTRANMLVALILGHWLRFARISLQPELRKSSWKAASR